jgi:flagellar biosynthesis/type III secretory pathway M-ring protein FliF/YscJ
MEEQLAQAKADAQRSHNAMVISIIAAAIAALAAVLTWLFPRH